MYNLDNSIYVYKNCPLYNYICLGFGWVIKLGMKHILVNPLWNAFLFCHYVRISCESYVKDSLSKEKDYMDSVVYLPYYFINNLENIDA